MQPGVVSAGNTIEVSTAQAQALHETNTDVKEMELAAIAEVAMLKNIPLIGLKTVSDFIDIDNPDDAFEQFMENFQKVAAHLTEKLIWLVEKL